MAFTQSYQTIPFGANTADIYNQVQTVRTAISSCAETLAKANENIMIERVKGEKRDSVIDIIKKDLIEVSDSQTRFSDQLREMKMDREKEISTLTFAMRKNYESDINEAVSECKKEDERHHEELSESIRELKDNIAQTDEVVTVKKQCHDLRENISIIEERVDVIISREESAERAFDRLNDTVSNLSERLERVESDLSYAESDISGIKKGKGKNNVPIQFNADVNDKMNRVISLVRSLECREGIVRSYTLKINGNVLAERTNENGNVTLNVNL